MQKPAFSESEDIQRLNHIFKVTQLPRATPIDRHLDSDKTLKLRQEYVNYVQRHLIPFQNIISDIPSNIIGKGGFGRVFKVIRRDPVPALGDIQFKNSYVALKEHNDYISPFEIETKTHKDVVAEGKLFECHDHANIIKFLGFWLKYTKSSTEYKRPASDFDQTRLCIVLEYAAGGSLNTFLRNFSDSNYNIHPRTVIAWSKDIAKGLNYLHNQNIVHSDIKSHNILLCIKKDSKQRENMVDVEKELFEGKRSPADVPEECFTLKISDFGTAQNINSAVKQKPSQKLFGTGPWMAPELWLVDTNHRETSFASDIWSLGVLFWEIITQRVPYEGIEYAAIGIMVSIFQVQWLILDKLIILFVHSSVVWNFHHTQIFRV